MKEFLKEVDGIEAGLLAGTQAEGESMECSIDPIGDGDTKIGVVEDLWVRALFLACFKRYEALLKLQKTATRADRDRLSRLACEYEALIGLAWAETRSVLDVSDVNAIALRAGWVVVASEVKKRTLWPGIIFASIVDGVLVENTTAEDCDDPTCPVHGRKTQA